mgnify:CR=1 FL=1
MGMTLLSVLGLPLASYLLYNHYLQPNVVLATEDEETGKLMARHHPFCLPHEEDLDLLDVISSDSSLKKNEINPQIVLFLC